MATRDDPTLLMRSLEWGNGAGAVDPSMTLMGRDLDAESASADSRDVFVMLVRRAGALGELRGAGERLTSLRSA